MKGFLAELRRRHVFKVAGIYGVVAWVLAQSATMAEEPLFLPGWFDTFVLISPLLGFPAAMLLAWAFDLTPDGVKRTGCGQRRGRRALSTPRRRDRRRTHHGVRGRYRVLKQYVF